MMAAASVRAGGATCSLVAAIAALCAVAQPVARVPATAGHRIESPSLHPPGPEYGTQLPAQAIGVGPTMDVAVADGFIFAIGKGKLHVLENARQGRPTLVGGIADLGNTRQIVVSRGYAFITSREDGLFIVDVRAPAAPKLVHHYDTAELATAIAVSGEVAAVGNRFAGIELLDVSQPSAPRYLTTIRVGEVQSLVFHGEWLYAGTWSEKAVAVINVSNPRRPMLKKTVPLDGNGDGLDVRGNLLAAATGHHSRSDTRPRPGDPAFGRGHGVEVFDVANPADPRRLSGVKFPPFYRLGMDMWGVVLAGGHAFVNDTHNGFFLIDVRDPEKPRNVGWAQLPNIRGDPSPAAGLAVSQGRVFLAGGFDDLHLLDTPPAREEPPAATTGLKVPAPVREDTGQALLRYTPSGSVRAVVPWREDRLLVAAGSAGLQVVRTTKDGFQPMAVYPTRGFARDVAFQDATVYVAESLGGLSRWKVRPDGVLERAGTYEVPGRSIHQVVLADEGRVGFLAVGGNSLHVVRLAEDGKIERLLESTPPSGLFYREPISPTSADGRRVMVQWHTNGFREYVANNGTVLPTGYNFPHAMDTECGAAPWREDWLATSRRGFFVVRTGESRSPAQLGQIRVGGRPRPGKPTVYGDTAFIADPFLGDVSVIDLTDENSPRLLGEIRLSGHPGRVRPFRGKVLIPAGRDGLLLWDPRAVALQP